MKTLVHKTEIGSLRTGCQRVSRRAHSVAEARRSRARQRARGLWLQVQQARCWPGARTTSCRSHVHFGAPGKCRRSSLSQARQGASAGLTCSLLELQNHRLLLLLLSEFPHIPILGFSFNRRIGTIRIFLYFTAREASAQTFCIYELENHVNCLYFSGEM